MAAEADASGGPLLVLTPQLRDAARRAAAEGRGEFLQFVREDAEALPLTRARGLAEWAGVPLHELLAGSRIKTAPPEERKMSPEVAAHFAKLRARHERAEFDRLTRSARGARDNSGTEPEGMRSLALDLGVGLNMIALMATGFFVFYLLGQRLDGGSKLVPVVSGLVGLVGAMLVETILFMIREEKAAALRKRRALARSDAPALDTAAAPQPAEPADRESKKRQ